MAMRMVGILVTLLALAVCDCTAQDDLDLGRVTERHVMIPMRDGVRLSAYLYFPEGADLDSAARGSRCEPAGSGGDTCGLEKTWPVVFEQRYADLRGAGTRKAAAKLSQEGFVVALVSFRGSQMSEGTWVGYRALGWGDLQDGYDICEWLAAQPWSSGKVGTLGSSQGGYAQNFLAVAQPPHLVCQYMVDTGLSLFHEGYRIGGTTRPERFKAMDRNCRDPADNRRLMADWFGHPLFDAYWEAEDCSRHFDRMNVPCFTIGSWFDFMNQGSIASFQGRQDHGGPGSRGRQQLLIGPWLHGRLNKGNRVSELVFPDNAVWPEHEHSVRWFKHWLNGEDNGVERDPAVRYYVMGAAGEDGPGNVWRTANDFPPLSIPTSFYVHTGGLLDNTLPGEDGGSTSYTSDPRHPMEIPGTSFPGAADARAFERQSEVRTFTTEPLAAPQEWTGRVHAELFIASTARDTDFIVRICDVYPDGRSILLIDYPWRARYREGFDHESLLDPGRVTKLAFDVGWLSHIFYRGHRIRVTVASTGAPLYEPNPQTGEPLTIEFPNSAVAATNTVYHRRDSASRIIAPVYTRVRDTTDAVAASSEQPGSRPHLSTQWKAGIARAVVTPETPVWLAGYGSKRVPDGKLHDIWAKALALEDSIGTRAVLVTSDFQGIPQRMCDRVCAELHARYQLERKQVMLTFSHNHCGPRLSEDLEDYYPFEAEQTALVDEYTKFMEAKLVKLVGDAIANLAPANLQSSKGETGFAVNRRNNREADIPELLANGTTLNGPVDHSVPVLTITRPGADEPAAIVFGYACHPTTLSFTQWCGDYPGFAQLELEQNHPGATAMFVNTCGGDQNPLPRRQVELCQRYGHMLAEAVETALKQPATVVASRLNLAFRQVELPYEKLATREELEAASKESNAIRSRWAARMLHKLDIGVKPEPAYPYPIHAWRFGDEMLFVGMGGEAVVDYSLRFKKEFGPQTWVLGYTDNLVSYIPSRRVWEEGGYEGGSNLYEYGRPGVRWAGDVEDRIAATVHDLVKTVAYGK